MILAPPNSWGTQHVLTEFNKCHSPENGQFCSAPDSGGGGVEYVPKKAGDIEPQPNWFDPVRKPELHGFWNTLKPMREWISGNTMWDFLQTPKGQATASFKSIYGTEENNALELFWLIAIDRGAGRAALKLITAAADKHNVILYGDAVPLSASGTAGKTLSKTKLEAFYRGFGFKIGKRGKDGYARMRRAPAKRTRESFREYNKCHGPEDGRFCSAPDSGGGGAYWQSDSQRPSRRIERLKTLLPVVDDEPYRTKFVLPDGTRLGGHPSLHQGAPHRTVLGKVGYTMAGTLALGVIRVQPYAGAEIGAQITSVQAERLVDYFATNNSGVTVDIRSKANGPVDHTKVFDLGTPPETLRAYVNARVGPPLTALEEPPLKIRTSSGFSGGGPLKLRAASAEQKAEPAQAFLSELRTLTVQDPFYSERSPNTAHRILGDAEVQMHATDYGGPEVHLDQLKAITAMRTGAGTKAMQTLTRLADKHKVRLTLTADPINGPGGQKIPKGKLVAFYKRHGFTLRGRASQGRMWRKPR